MTANDDDRLSASEVLTQMELHRMGGSPGSGLRTWAAGNADRSVAALLARGDEHGVTIRLDGTLEPAASLSAPVPPEPQLSDPRAWKPRTVYVRLSAERWWRDHPFIGIEHIDEQPQMGGGHITRVHVLPEDPAAPPSSIDTSTTAAGGSSDD